jgi:hypothetical protein
MASVLEEKHNIEEAFNSIITKFNFKKVYEDTYRIGYSNGKSILSIFSAPYEDLFEIAFERDTIGKKAKRLAGYQDFDANNVFYLDFILEAIDKDNVRKQAVKESRILHKQMNKRAYTHNSAKEIRRKELIIWAKAIEENLQSVIIGNFDFKTKYKKIAQDRGDQDLKELMDKYQN